MSADPLAPPPSIGASSAPATARTASLQTARGEALRILTDHPMDALNTFGFPARAERYAEAPDEATLVALLQRAERERWPVFVLGGGSNLVLTRDVPGLTIRMTDARVVLEVAGPDGELRVSAGAGVGWHALVETTLDAGAGGLENLALIPGTVGAAPVQNIGAYGVELADRLERVRAWHRPSGRFVELAAAECGFGYRDSRFKRERGDWIIVRADFVLGPHHPRETGYASLERALFGTAGRVIAPTGPVRAGSASRTDDAAVGPSPAAARRAPSAREVADAVISVRRSKLPDPATTGNAGSFFHNPIVSAAQASSLRERHPALVSWPAGTGREKLAAGWLIERLGYRGVRRGAVGVHAEQALVLVNDGGGTGVQLLALVEEIVTAVREVYGVALVIEPVIV